MNPQYNVVFWLLTAFVICSIPAVRRRLTPRVRRIAAAVLALCICAILIWEYPVERWLAYRAYQSLGITRDITSMVYTKDTKRGGYHLTVVYEDEPDAGYIYYFGGAGRTMTLEDIEAGGRQTTEEN